MIKNSLKYLFCLLLCACIHTQQHYIGEEYLGATYKRNPLGEGKKPDTDPLIRTDAFDCTTFVETSLAYGDVDKLTKIRYKNGEVDFLNRNHFTELDWLKNNRDMFENVSAKYGSTATRTVTIDKKNWFKKVHKIKTDFPRQTVQVKYIPYSNLKEINNSDTLIVLFVSGNANFYEKFGTDLAVVHMGFLLPNGMLRHASRHQGKVLDVDFQEYVKERKQEKNNLGVALIKIK